MCSGCSPSTATCRPSVFGKTTASARNCGKLAARSSGPTIVLQMQGLSLRSLGGNGSSPRAVVQLLLQLPVRPWRWQMESCITKTNSGRKLGRLGSPARTGPPGAWAQGPACLPVAVSAAISAVVELWLLIEANTAGNNGKPGSKT